MRTTFSIPAVGPREAIAQRGLTLIELTVSLVIMVIVLGAITSAVVIASHAIPDGTGPLEAGVRGSEAANQIARELCYAISFEERSSTAVAFTIADRYGTKANDTVRYAWSGTAGDPLTRQYNGGKVITFLDNVSEFDLAYDLQEVTEQSPGPGVEGAETELMGYDSVSDLQEAHIHDNLWWAEYFKPTLPSDAVSWTVTRVQFQAKRDSNDGTTTLIQLRLPAADITPSATVVDVASMAQLSLTDSFQWVERSFTSATGLSPDVGLCLTFITDDNKSCQLRYQDNNVSLPNTGFMQGTPDWQSPATDQALLFHVYGTVSTPGSPVDVTRQYVTGVRLTLRVGGSSEARIHTGTGVLNAPEV